MRLAREIACSVEHAAITVLHVVEPGHPSQQVFTAATRQFRRTLGRDTLAGEIVRKTVARDDIAQAILDELATGHDLHWPAAGWNIAWRRSKPWPQRSLSAAARRSGRKILPCRAVVLAAKLVMTAASIGGGSPGGVFAPSLFLGATLGGAYGMIAVQLFPRLSIAPPAYAMVGMAAVLAASVHAPLTAILLLFEMTHDYRIILPLMAAVVVAMLLSQWLRRDSVYTLGLARKGLRLERGRNVEVLEGLTVGEVMNTGVRALATLVTYPDETIGAALRRMSGRDVGRLPVVAREDPRRLLGVLRRVDLVRAYDIALTRRATMRHRAHQNRLDAATAGLSVEEITIQPGASCDRRRVREVAWPRNAVIASLRRGGQMLIPHGDTLLQAGDVLVVVMETDFYAAMLVPPFGPRPEWAESLAESLLQPEFPISTLEAFGRRLRVTTSGSSSCWRSPGCSRGSSIR